ncbi:MAG: hypothetical protein HZC24_12895 [Rhodocyclales bacterium]|nr:hypothetical protein [Rhodocyclales bacterium]
MRAFFVQQWKLLLLFVMLVLWLALFPRWARLITADPLNEAIMLLPKGEVHKEIQIPLAVAYELDLAFEQLGTTYEKLKLLLEGEGGNAKAGGGIGVPIRWSLRQQAGGAVMASGEVDTRGTAGWSPTAAYRLVAPIAVPPGRYMLDAEILRDVPELGYVRTRLVLQLPSEAATPWQVTVMWWAGVIDITVLLPATLFLGVFLVVRATKVLRAK